MLLFSQALCNYNTIMCGLFGNDFNLVVWQIFVESPNLNHDILKTSFVQLVIACHGY